MIDTELLFSFLAQVVSCHLCSSDVVIIHELEKKQGFAHFISVKCSSDTCDWQGSFCTSKQLKSTKGRPPFEVNIRTVLAFREIGKGHTAIKKYCGCMNMAKSINDSACAAIVSKLNVAYKDIVNTSMSIAAEEIRNENTDTISDDTVDIDISADGAWQRRGFASLNGIVTIMAVDIGKCLDYEVLTKECKACQVWSRKKGSIEYNDSMADHDCLINHQGSASSMEPAGILSCFQRSILKHKLRYTSYIGDGDSSSFTTVSKADPYNGTSVIKKNVWATCKSGWGHV